jgi:hypothetical protein
MAQFIFHATPVALRAAFQLYCHIIFEMANDELGHIRALRRE